MIANVAHVEIVLNIPTITSDDIIKSHLRTAAFQFKKAVGADYDIWAADASSSSYDFDSVTHEETAIAANAEAYLTAVYLIPALNTVIQSSNDEVAGISIKGNVGDDEASYSYLSPAQVKQMTTYYKGLYATTLDMLTGGGVNSEAVTPVLSYSYTVDGVAVNDTNRLNGSLT